MPDKNTGPEAAGEGIVEDVKGRLKEGVGSLIGNDKMKQEGEAQQKKADAARDVAKNEAQAEKARAEQAAHEAEQRAQQQ